MFGVFIIVFFGCFAFIGITKIITKRPGLILNSDGFKKRLYGQNIFIYWEDVENIDWYKINQQKIIRVTLKSNNCLKFDKGKLQGIWVKMEQKFSGSSVTLTSNPLEVGFDELFDLMLDYKKASEKI